MKTTIRFLKYLIVMTYLLLPVAAFAGSISYSTVGAGGYDLVSYRNGEKPQRGNGNHMVVHDGVAYLFDNENNKKTFVADPDRYLPMYGGYCAYGVAVGKKFIGDPDVWAIVDGKLYLNLDNKIQGLWNKDVPGFIKKANAKWALIQDKDPSDL